MEIKFEIGENIIIPLLQRLCIYQEFLSIFKLPETFIWKTSRVIADTNSIENKVNLNYFSDRGLVQQSFCTIRVLLLWILLD